MKKMINKNNIEGLLYEHKLELKQAGPNAKNPGSNYIRGSISIEVTEDNVVTVDILQTEFSKKGRDSKFDEIVKIMNAPTVLGSSRETAAKIKVNSAFDLNDWFNDAKEHISNLRVFNGFISIEGKIDPKATFEVDMLITSTTEDMEKDETGVLMPNGSLVVNGFIFNFKNEIMPVKFIVENEKGVEYFKALTANTFTKVWGKMVTQSFHNHKVEESAFGDDKVVDYTSTRKKNVITGTNVEAYVFGDATILTVEEVQAAIANRNIKLEQEKNRVKQGATTPATPAGNVANANPNSAFKF